jgi:hypothetical protein
MSMAVKTLAHHNQGQCPTQSVTRLKEFLGFRSTSADRDPDTPLRSIEAWNLFLLFHNIVLSSENAT